MFGIALGSAGNALIDRLPRNESWFKGRSHCDKCKHELGMWDLIPIFSFIYLRGKCRYCQSPIPFRNIIIELFFGLVSINIITVINFINIIIFLTVWVSLVIAVMDWETKMVSEILILIWGILSLINGFRLDGILIGVGLIGGIWAVSRGRAMGFGDVEIAAVMGLSLGWQKMLAALWIAFVVGAAYGLVLMINKKAKFKSTVAFGPFLILGYWVAYHWGNNLIKYFIGYG